MIKWLIILIFLNNAYAKTINRNVLILWDSAVGETSANYDFSLSHVKLEVILNHYGLIADYLDINKKIPVKYFNGKYLKNYLGLITWFNDQRTNNPNELIKLLHKWQGLKRKTIIMGHFGFLSDLNSHNTPIKKVNKLLSKWDISITGEEFTNLLLLEVDKKSQYVEYERKLKYELSSALVVHSLSTKNKPHLILKNKVNKKISNIIIENKYLFFAYSGYELYQSPYNSVTQWRINPHYLVRWLIQRTTPIPDTTTLFGKRILYSHIDGDAFINVSRIDRKSYCGEIIKNQIINHYKLPISASLIAAEINQNYLGNKRILKMAQGFFNSPYVEAASHTYFHPMSWEKEPSSQDIEIYFEKKKKKYTGGPIVAYKFDDYKELDYKKEILGSLNYLNSKILKKNKSNIIFWSGSCRPPLEAMKIVNENHLLNINGGDSRFDTKFNSISHLYPIGKNIGPFIQIYSSNSNENTYTNLWEGPYVGFKDVIETFKNTDKPIRYKPINIYYHFYSGERISSLKALKSVYDWSIKQDIIPIYTSSFIKIARDFYNIKIDQVNNSTFKISNITDLRTIRLDKMIEPDYIKSKNIIGHKHINNSTYIFLNNTKSAKLVLANNKTKLTFPIIVSSDGFINNALHKNGQVIFDFRSNFGKRIIADTHGKKIKITSKIKTISYKNKLAYIELKNKSANIRLEFTK